MKTLFPVMILMACCLTLSCSKHSKLEDQISTAYIVSDSNVTIANIKIEDVDIYTSPGGYSRVLAVHYTKLEKNLASQAFNSGLVKPDLDFSDYGRHMKNAIYIEKNGTINSVQSLYIVAGSIINYRIVEGTLYIKKLTPVETHDLAENIKKRIKEKEIFIY